MRRGLASVFHGAVHKAPFNVNQYSYDDALKLYDGLRSRGYPDHVAAGITGNVLIENGGAGHLNTQRHQVGGGGGVGLFQLTNPTRKSEYNSFVHQNHLDPRQMDTALDFHDRELKGGAYNGYYKKHAYDPLMKTQNVNDATLSYMHNFENPRAKSAHADQRVALANEVYNRAQGRQAQGVPSQNAPSQTAGYDSLELRGENNRPSAIGDELGSNPFQRQSSYTGSQTAQPVLAPPKPDITKMQFVEGVHAPEPTQKLYAALDNASQRDVGTVMNPASVQQMPTQDFAGSSTPNDLGISNTMQQNNFADMNGFTMQPGAQLPSFAMANNGFGGVQGGALPATDLQPGAGDYAVTDFGGSGFGGGDLGGLASLFG